MLIPYLPPCFSSVDQSLVWREWEENNLKVTLSEMQETNSAL